MRRPDKEAIAIDNSLLDLTDCNRLRCFFSHYVCAGGPGFSLIYMCDIICNQFNCLLHLKKGVIKKNESIFLSNSTQCKSNIIQDMLVLPLAV